MGRNGAAPHRAWSRGRGRARSASQAVSITGRRASRSTAFRSAAIERRFGDRVLPRHRSTRTESRARRTTPGAGAHVHAVGRQQRSARASGARVVRRADLGARSRDDRKFLTTVLGFERLGEENGHGPVRLRRVLPASSTCAKRPKDDAGRGASAAFIISHGAWTTRSISTRCGRAWRRPGTIRRR